MVVEDLTTHEQFEDSYDKLVFTPGSRATLPPVKELIVLEFKSVKR